MTDLSTLTDQKLNKRLARAQGLVCNDGDGRDCPVCGIGAQYTDSLDALKSGPEKMLRDAGWQLSIVELDPTRWLTEWGHSKREESVWQEAPTEERARAEAVCQGLEVSK